MKIKNIALLDKDFLKTCVFLFKQDIPMKISYPLKKVIEVFEKEEKTFETFKNELIKKYGAEVKDAKGEETIAYDVFKASKENQDKYVAEFNDLVQMEFEIPIEKKLEIDINSSDFDGLKLSSEKLGKLELLIDFKF